jgi:hypothetical protein
LKSLCFDLDCFVGRVPTKQFYRATKPFFACHAELRKPRRVISHSGSFEAGLGEIRMHAVGLILAFAFVLVAPSMAGSVPSDLPGIGTFAYGGAPIAAPTMTVAAR